MSSSGESLHQVGRTLLKCFKSMKWLMLCLRRISSGPFPDIVMSLSSRQVRWYKKKHSQNFTPTLSFLHEPFALKSRQFFLSLILNIRVNLPQQFDIFFVPNSQSRPHAFS